MKFQKKPKHSSAITDKIFKGWEKFKVDDNLSRPTLADKVDKVLNPEKFGRSFPYFINFIKFIKQWV